MKANAYSTPAVHNVERIEAQSRPGSDFHALILTFSGTDNWQGPCEAEFKIFGKSEMGEKFERLAASINDIFGEHHPLVEALKPDDVPTAKQFEASILEAALTGKTKTITINGGTIEFG